MGKLIAFGLAIILTTVSHLSTARAAEIGSIGQKIIQKSWDGVNPSKYNAQIHQQQMYTCKQDVERARTAYIHDQANSYLMFDYGETLMGCNHPELVHERKVFITQHPDIFDLMY